AQLGPLLRRGGVELLLEVTLALVGAVARGSPPRCPGPALLVSSTFLFPAERYQTVNFLIQEGDLLDLGKRPVAVDLLDQQATTFFSEDALLSGGKLLKLGLKLGPQLALLLRRQAADLVAAEVLLQEPGVDHPEIGPSRPGGDDCRCQQQEQ